MLAAFVLRVLAQLVQFYSDAAWLPPFSAWAAGGLPYPVLIGLQIIIIAVAVDAIRKLARGALPAQRKWAYFLFGAGAVYFIIMALRLVAGLTILSEVPWFAATLPAIFHLVLASFLLVIGHYHWSRSKKPG
ncbi:MAG: hypothetical protein HKN28_16600 [Alphaproteobacteria bacterium]|nr:hypothetical protein [Alphaproteobacteria bacterium]